MSISSSSITAFVDICRQSRMRQQVRQSRRANGKPNIPTLTLIESQVFWAVLGALSVLLGQQIAGAF